MQIVFTRTAPGTYAEDVAVMHFDFLNMTAGAPDDTWTAGDYTAIEGHLTTWWNTLKTAVGTYTTLKELRWYRLGAGVTPPNPPTKVTPIGTAGSNGSPENAPQLACSISLHTGPRRNWGRTYLPGLTTFNVAATGGLVKTTQVDIIANATHTLLTAAAAADFYMVVYSKTRQELLGVEQIAVDNIWDIIRRRRWEHPTYKKTLP